jgi:hypothetical protein
MADFPWRDMRSLSSGAHSRDLLAIALYGPGRSQSQVRKLWFKLSQTDLLNLR